MKISWMILCSMLLLVLSGCGNRAVTPQSEFAAANQAVEHWMHQHPHGWMLNLSDSRTLTRLEWSRPCTETPVSGFTALRYASGATEIELFFECPLDAIAHVEDLTAAFSHAVLQKLPHGIVSPGWRFEVLTPTSSISEKVTFAAPSPGRLLVVIETPLYAVYGHSVRPSCQPPADAPSPEGCYLLREHRILLNLSLAVPFQGSELN